MGSICKYMLTDIISIIDKHKGKTGIVFAHGPSAKKHLPKLLAQSKDKSNFCFISMGEIDRVQQKLNIRFELDYWVMANSVMNILNSSDRFNSIPECTLILADSVDISPLTSAWARLKIPSMSYDQRHFDNKPCINCKIPDVIRDGKMEFVTWPCRVIPGRLTVQEHLQKYTKYESHFTPGSTVALNATAMAILMGGKEVHVYGVDLDYRGGYVDNTTVEYTTGFDPDVDYIVKDFDTIVKSAYNIGVKLINFSPNSPIKTVMETVS